MKRLDYNLKEEVYITNEAKMSEWQNDVEKCIDIIVKQFILPSTKLAYGSMGGATYNITLVGKKKDNIIIIDVEK